MPNPYHWIRRLPPQSAFLVPLSVEGRMREVSWLIRKTSSTIEALKSNCAINQRGGVFGINLVERTVMTLFLQIGLGKEPFDQFSISEVFLNEHAPVPYGGTIESLTTQEVIPIHLFGDSGELEHSMAAPNIAKRFAVKAMSILANSPPWTPEEFDQCLTMLFDKAPTVMDLWNGKANA